MWSRISYRAAFVLVTFGALIAAAKTTILDPIVLAHFILGALLLLFGWGKSRQSVPKSESLGSTSFAKPRRYLPALTTLLLVIILNTWVRSLDLRWDLSSLKQNSLSPQSEKIALSLTQPLTITLILSIQRGEEDADAQRLLEKYRRANPDKIKIDTIDAAASPHLLTQNNIRPSQRILIKYGTGEIQVRTRLNYATEEAITGALLNLTSGKTRVGYVVEGIGGAGIDDTGVQGLNSLKLDLQTEGIELRGLILGENSTIPDDAAVVLIVGGKLPLSEGAKSTLVSYVKRGGRVFVASDPLFAEDVKVLSAAFGIKVEDGVVVDRDAQLFSPGALGLQPLIKNFIPHPITDALRRGGAVIMNIASPLSMGEPLSNFKVTPLLITGPNAVVEPQSYKLLTGQLNPEEIGASDGNRSVPPVLAAAAEELPQSSQGSPGGKIIIFGDSDWIRNSAYEFYSNSDLALNSLQWLAGQEVAMAARSQNQRTAVASMSYEEYVQMLSLSCLALELILGLGLFVFIRRNKMELRSCE